MNSWVTVSLSDIASLQSGTGFPIGLQGRRNGEFPFYKVGDISRVARAGGSRLGAAQHYVNSDDLKLLGARLIPADAITFAKIGEAIQQNFFTLTSRDCLVDNNAMAVIANQQIVDPKFLYHFLKTVNLYSLAEKTSVPSIRKSTLERIKVRLPSLFEQRRIAAILDKTETLRAKRRQALAKIDSLSQSLLAEMFRGLLRDSWISLGDLIIEGPQNGLYRPSTDYGNGTPILRIDAFYDGKVTGLATLKRLRIPEEEIARYGLREDDIVINRVNSLEYLGKSAIIPALSEPVVFESNMMRFRVDTSRIDPTFAICALQMPGVRSQVLSRAKNAVNQSSINQQDVQSLRLPLPPLIMQARFRNVVRTAQGQAERLSLGKVALDKMSASLQSLAFQGGI